MGATTETEHVLIVGAGLAGLSAAISIAKLGMKVTVAERSEALADGAMITLSNRGPDALAELGVLEQCLRTAHVGRKHSVYHDFFDAAGNRLPAADLPIREDDGMPVYLFMYRPELARILAERAEDLGVTIRRGVALKGLVDTGDSVTATFESEETQTFDLVVAADGTTSRIREQIFPGRVVPAYSGNMSMRWVKRNPPSGQDGAYINEQSHALFIHSLGSEMVYIAAGVNMENRPVGKTEGLELFREALSEFSAPRVKELLTLVEDDDEVIVRPYTFHNLPAPWNSGRILLIGDAAHTMSAHLGAGGVMALEDGVVLAQELSVGDELQTALLRFARRRARRTYVAVDACRQMLDLQVNYSAENYDLHRVREAAFHELLKAY